MTSPTQYRAMESLVRKGPMTIVLVYSPSCPHCHTYMPLWKEMCALKRKRANLVSMEASTYDKTPMSEKKPVSGVPTVLFVDKEGRITEAEEPRNRDVMATAVTHGVSESEASAAPPPPATAPMVPSIATPTSADLYSRVSEVDTVVTPPSRRTTSEPLAGTQMPAGTEVLPNPLNAMPAQPVPSTLVTPGIQYGGGSNQSGGNPWAAFLQAAAQAAPAAVMAGAYAISKARRRTVRSSGLPAPRHSAKWRRIRAGLLTRRRR
jgi:hypothetical protein